MGDIGGMWGEIKYLGRKNLLVYVTSKCNQRCSHCFYLSKINVMEDSLSIENVRRILPRLPRIRDLCFTGGEPFLRNDLKEMASLFVDYLDAKRLEVDTNGSFSDRTYDFCKNYLSRYRKKKLTIQLSILGPASVHDSITGIKGSFEKLDETVTLLAGLNKKYKNIEIYFCVPIMRSNYKEAPFLMQYANNNNIMIKFSPLKSVTKTVHAKTSLHNTDFVVNDETLFLKNDEYRVFLQNVEKEIKKYKSALWPKRDRLRNHAYLFVNSGHSLGECRFRKNNLIFFSNGDYSMCELLKPIGNILDDNGDLAMAKENFKKWIENTKQCFCSHGSYIFNNMKQY